MCGTRLLKIVLALSMALSTPWVASADGEASSRSINNGATAASPEMSITFRLPRMTPAVFCNQEDCHTGSMPVPDDGDEMTLTFRPKTSPPSTGTAPSSPPITQLEASAPTYGDSYSDSGYSNFSTFVGDGNSLGVIYRHHQQEIGSGLGGALNHFEQEAKANRRADSAAAEIRRDLQQKSAEINRYPQSAANESAKLANRTRFEESRTYGQIARAGEGVGQALDLVDKARFAALAQSPLTVHDYKLNDEARTQIVAKIRRNLKAENYARAATDLEALAYDTEPGSLPSDLAQLFNANGIVTFETYDAQLPTSPLSSLNIETARNSDFGQIVRRSANQFQATWAESQGLADWSNEHKLQYLAGLTYLLSADNDLAAGRTSGLANLEIANTLLMAAKGFAIGAGNGAIDFVKSIPELAHLVSELGAAIADDPVNVAKKTYQLIEALPQVKDALWSAAFKTWQQAKNGTAYERGKIAGRIVFEAGFLWATSGLGATAETAKAAEAAKSTKAMVEAARSIEPLAQKFGSYSTTFNVALEEIGRMPSGLRNQLIELGSVDPSRMHSILGLYRDAALADFKDAAEIAGIAIKNNNPKAIEFVRAGLRSQLDPEHHAKFLKNASDVNRIFGKYTLVETKLGRNLSSSIEGFKSRAGLKARFLEDPSAVMNRHPGNIEASGRMAIKGQFGQSVGFGLTPTEASAVAEKEFASYFKETPEIISHAVPFKAENVLDLTDPTILRQLNLTAEQLTIERTEANAYELTQILGHAAQSHGFSGILTWSAVARGQKVLHWLK